MGNTDKKLNEYSIEFTAIEETIYSVNIKAESPEEALKLFEDQEYHDFEYHEECYNGIISKSDIEIVGHWIKDNKTGSQRLKRYDDPIPLEKEKKIFVCEKCGMDDVDIQAWININTNEYSEDMECGRIFCNRCEDDCTVIEKTITK